MMFLRQFVVGSMLAIAATATRLLESRQNVAPSPVTGDNFIHDPTVVKTPGGITCKAANNNIISIATRPENSENAIEAPVIVRHGDYYYLWVSFDRCCKGADSTCRIMVGRSSSITCPYVDKSGKSLMQGGGTRIISSHSSVHGPGRSTDSVA